VRYGIFSDIHGNTVALDAVLKALNTLNVEGYLVLGDLCVIGYDPVGVLERITRLQNALYIRGNGDRYVYRQERPFPHVEDVKADSSLFSVFQDVERGFAWTQGALQATGWFEWVGALPLEQGLTLPDGTRVLCVHASPGKDAGKGFNPKMDDETLAAQLGQPDADLVLVGHSHWQWDYRINGVHVVNNGCVSNARPPDVRASFAVLDATPEGYNVQYYRVSYDNEAAIRAAYAAKYPAAHFLETLYAGNDEKIYTEDPLYPDYIALEG
jgi:predicted phosphodiesterase